MKKIVVLAAVVIAIGWGVFALAENTKDPVPKQPVDLKERIEKGEKRLALAEARLKADSELRAEELKAAQHELENAKSLLAAGKETEAQGALLKARRHAMFAMGHPNMRRHMMMRMRGGPGMGRPGMGWDPGKGMNPGMGCCPMGPDGKDGHREHPPKDQPKGDESK